MPVLEILTPDGKFHPASGYLLMAHALYPSDPALQQEYAYISLFDAILDQRRDSQGQEEDMPESLGLAELEEMVPASGYDLLEILVESRSPDTVLANAAERRRRADTAGKMAYWGILAYSDPEIERPSLEKVVAVLQEGLNDPLQVEEYGSIGERTIWDRWSEFKAASHIHAAIEMVSQIEPETLMLMMEGIPSSLEEASSFLAEESRLPESISDEERRKDEEALMLAAQSFFLGDGLPTLLSLIETLRLKMEELRIVKPGELYTLPASLEIETRPLPLLPMPEELKHHFL